MTLNRLLLLSIALTIWSCNNDEHKEIDEIDFWTQSLIDKYSSGLRSITTINSDAYFDHTVKDVSPFENITSIAGTLRIQSSELKNTQSFKNLKSVGAIDIRGNSMLSTIYLESLENINRNLSISGNNQLTSIEAPRLEAIENHGIDIVDNDKLTYCLFPKLKQHGGLNIRTNPRFTTLDLPNPIPKSAENDIYIEFDTMITQDVLFKRTTNFGKVKIKANHTAWENMKWILNSPNAILGRFTVEAPLKIEDLCGLKDYLKQITYHPSNLKIIWKGNSFDGNDIIQACE